MLLPDVSDAHVERAKITHYFPIAEGDLTHARRVA